MPTYDYECKDCGHVFEVFQSMSDDAISTCESCGGSVKRLIGGGLGVIFKGSGFYVTDNKSSNGTMNSPPKTSSSEGSEKKADSDSSKPKKEKKKEPAAKV